MGTVADLDHDRHLHDYRRRVHNCGKDRGLARGKEMEEVMTIALWVIALIEAVRLIEQTLQLRLLVKDTGARDNAYAEFVKSLKVNDRKFVKRLLKELEENMDESEDYDWRDEQEYRDRWEISNADRVD